MAPKLRFCVTMLLVAGLATGCGGSVTLDIAYRPPEVDRSPLAAIPGRRIQLGSFSDPGGGTTLVGQRKAAFDAPWGTRSRSGLSARSCGMPSALSSVAAAI